MRRLVLLAFAMSTVGVSCRARKTPPATLAPIDKVYARYKEDHTWIDPNDSTELVVARQNEGSFATCAQCDYEICYEDLPIEKRLQIDSEDDYARLVPWLRDSSACVRRIAEHILWSKLGLPGDGRSVSVQDREGYEYHSIVSALKGRLDRMKTAYDPKLFDGMMVSLTDADFAAVLIGTWRQDLKNDWKQLTVEIAPDHIRATDAPIKPDPEQHARTWTDTFDQAHVNAKQQFEIIARSELKHDRHYLFWPVTKDLVWLAYSNEGVGGFDGDTIRWTKMRH